MVITMQKRANDLMVERVVRFFEERGCRVHVKNEQAPILVAAFGPEADNATFFELERLPGIAEVDRTNKIFLERYKEFIEAWEYFRALDA